MSEAAEPGPPSADPEDENELDDPDDNDEEPAPSEVVNPDNGLEKTPLPLDPPPPKNCPATLVRPLIKSGRAWANSGDDMIPKACCIRARSDSRCLFFRRLEAGGPTELDGGGGASVGR